MKHSLLLLSVVPLAFLQCKSRAIEEPTNRGDIKGTVNVPTDERTAAIQEADAWGEYWEPGMSKAQVDAKDAEVINAISSRNTFDGPENKTFNPSGSETFADDTLECNFIEPDPQDPPGGRTPKFECEAPKLPGTKKKLKIKYDPSYNFASNGSPQGKPNHGLYGEIIASRILWALGFKQDINYPTRVVCLDCPEDPWLYVRKKTGVLDSQDSRLGLINTSLESKILTMPRVRKEFFPAATEFKINGDILESSNGKTPITGWGFDEVLNSKMYTKSGSADRLNRQEKHREALTIMAGFFNHADNKPDNQRIICLDDWDPTTKKCNKPFLVLHDPGNVMGLGWVFFGNLFSLDPSKAFSTSKLEREKWEALSMWKGGKSESCVLHVNKHQNGSLQDMKISPSSLAFVKSLISKLSDKQIEGALRAGRVEFVPGGAKKLVFQNGKFVEQAVPGGDTVQEWVKSIRNKINRDLMGSKCV